MKQHELMELIGLATTDVKMVNFFEQHQLGKLPKRITPNQNTKSLIFKPLNISFWFKYDITNNRFQPPISPKNDDYKFVAYLSSIMFTHVDDSVKKPDPKDDAFWDVIPSPLHSGEEIAKLMGPPTYEIDSLTIYEKIIEEDKVLKVFYNREKKNTLTTSCQVSIVEQSEILSRIFFDSKYNHESMVFLRNSFAIIIKWLYDNHYLMLDQQIYQRKLANNTDDVLTFIHQELNSHLWSNQLTNETYLGSFLYTISSNRNTYDANGNKVYFYIQDIILDCLGKREEFEKVYEENFNQVDYYLDAIVFDGELYRKVIDQLTIKFKQFKALKLEKN